ncbi:hypothetical protein FY136_00760 [Agrobacterium tumefaciens]|uniref:hypothetical protein n=1 Tax=Agrobacterium tumefaciens TaxID=358 RepID=UPI0021CDEF4E|nr:hypothetical protein [Agrobacterium tumefaciens]UXT47839.1 hypothetical protein FY136_00760 [Agrobacterium tumefaciens]
MSKTAKFNTTVVIGKDTYAPGKPVPIGTGKKELSEAEARKLVENFGPWTAGDGKADPDATLAAVIAERDAAVRDAARAQELQARVTLLENELQTRIGLLDVEVKKSAELESRPTAQSLADEKARADQLQDDNEVLANQIDAMGKEIEDLKKRVPK